VAVGQESVMAWDADNLYGYSVIALEYSVGIFTGIDHGHCCGVLEAHEGNGNID